MLKNILEFIMFAFLLLIVYSFTVYWFCQISGSLFYTFPRIVIALFKKEIKTIKPVLITLSPVFFWSLIVGIINLIFYICWYKAFIYFYTNIIILIVIGIAMIQCLLQIGNSEMQNYADNLIDKYKLKEG